MAKTMERGYFGIGIFHCKNETNVGTLWRSAAILGASFIFTIGKRYKTQASDTIKAPRHIPLLHYRDYDDFFQHLPYDCPVIAVELADNSVPLEKFVHPERCIYLLGAEDNGIPESILVRCRNTVQLIGDICYNVSTAGSIVMYDRAVKGRREAV